MYSEHSCMDDSHHIFSVYLVEINYPLLGPSSGWNPARGKVWRSPCQDGMRREEENRRQFERGPPPQQLKVSVSWICIAGPGMQELITGAENPRSSGRKVNQSPNPVL
nr:uncharacterized protein LOC106831827 isoform X3 [Equus asinus]